MELPVLDLEEWIESVDVNGRVRPQVLHSHYEREMSNKKFILKDSALTMSSKMNILVADLVRIVRNVLPLCNENERTLHVQHFVNRMQFSGCNQRERTDDYLKALARFEEITERARTGEVPLYGSKFWNREDVKKEKRESCYKKDDYKTVLFVDVTTKWTFADSFQKLLELVLLE